MYVKLFCALFFIAIFIRNIPLGSAISCYYCEEAAGRQCDLNARKSLVRNCTDLFVCSKFIWTEKNVSIIYRSCEQPNICEVKRAEQTANRTITYCGTCNTSLCNSATLSSYSSIGFSFSVVFALFQRLFV